jgi:endonuclease G
MKPDPYNYSLTNDNLCYNLKGFDKGHCMPANNNKCCSLCMEQCFYYSNIAPQLHKLNIGNWQLLECAERNEAIKYDSIDVITGNVGCFQKMGVQQISIPRYWYKIIYIPITKTYQCWIFNNTGFSDETLPVYPVPVSYFENLCNYKIIYGHVILH